MRAGRVARVLAAASAWTLFAMGAGSCSSLEGDPVVDARPNPPPATGPRPGGHLVYAIEGDPNGLDPTRNAWDPNGIMLANALYDPLVAVDAEGRFQPYLARSFEADPTFTSWTIALRPGVTFTNGDPLDADALVGFLKGLRESVITGPPVQMVRDVRAVDPLTVRITTTKPWATLPALFSGQGGYVVSPKQIADPQGSEHPVGTGPFMLRRWQQDRSFELVRNPRYWRPGLPHLDAVDFRVLPEGTERLDALTTGAADATNLSAEWDVQRLDETMADPGVAGRLDVRRDTSDTEKSFVMFNTARRPLDDVRVRRALGHATDVAALAAGGGWPLDRLAQGPLSPGTPFFDAAPYPAHDVAKAKALVREYLSDTRVRNRPREVAFTLTANDIDAKLAHSLARQWGEAGIKVQVAQADAKDILRLAAFGEYDAMPWHYFANVDPDVLWHFFVGDTVTDLVSLNFTRQRNAAITAGMNDGRATLDPARRREAYGRVQEALADTMPYVWLSRSEWRVVTANRVRDARNVTLPDGGPAQPLTGGTHRLTETWVDR
jgi:peptide/nickel transport system substrate-binding protein